MAYSRMLRWYYRKERPLPADVAEVCRQIRAATDLQREAVSAVLQEFFELREDGWHQSTCDEVIASYRAGEPEREAKKKNEDTRLSRHRAERAELFAVINAAGLHRPWNTPISELRELAGRLNAGLETLQAPTPATPPAPSAAPASPLKTGTKAEAGTTTNEPATQSATATATPATATQTPVPNTQTPIPNIEEVYGSAAQTAPPPLPAFIGEKNEAAIPPKAKVLLADRWELPTAWGVDAEALGFTPPEILRESERFRQYYVAGKGKGTRRSLKGWRQGWSNWLGNAERFRRTA